jgi:hypothetical protein
MEINVAGEAIDTLLSLSGKIGRWLNVRGDKRCFIIWGFVTSCWIARNAYLNLWSQSLFCLISVGFHVYGYWNWGNKKIGVTK